MSAVATKAPRGTATFITELALPSPSVVNSPSASTTSAGALQVPNRRAAARVLQWASPDMLRAIVQVPSPAQ
jgi:hypothetical protein